MDGKDRKDRLEDLMSAIAFAEAGEHDQARRLMSAKKNVLLVLLGKESDERAARYAASICQRIRAGLEILCMSTAAKMKKYFDHFDKEGIRYRVTEREGCIKKEIIGMTEKRKDIEFVVIESSEVLDLDCRKEDRTLTDAWRKLKCPLVLVSKGELTSPAQA